MIKGTPDLIEYISINNKKVPCITELRTFSSSSPHSKENAIFLSTIRLSLYSWLTGLHFGKTILFDISRPNVNPTEFLGPTFFLGTTVLKNSIITALLLYTVKKKAEQKAKAIIKGYKYKMKEYGYL